MGAKAFSIEAGDALIVVDVQNDFCPGGALAVSDGDRVVPVINALTPRFGQVVFTRDWHPPEHCSFADPAQFVDKSWPVHCVANSAGAAFHPDLYIPEAALIVSKGTAPDREAYSGFEGTSLANDLRIRKVQRVIVCGLATDYCVKATALDALAEGFEVVVIEDGCRAVDNPPGTGAAALREMASQGVNFVNSNSLGL